MGNLVKETPYSEITATLEVLAHLGVKREHFMCIRADRECAKQVAMAIAHAATEFVRSKRAQSLSVLLENTDVERRYRSLLEAIGKAADSKKITLPTDWGYKDILNQTKGQHQLRYYLLFEVPKHTGFSSEAEVARLLGIVPEVFRTLKKECRRAIADSMKLPS